MSAQLLRTEAVAAFGRAREDMLTLVTMQAVDPWNALGQADERNFNVVEIGRASCRERVFNWV